MKTIISAITLFVIMIIPLAICSVTNTDNVLFLAPSIVWVFGCPVLILFFYDNIEAFFTKKANQ